MDINSLRNPLIEEFRSKCIMAIDFGEKFMGISLYRVGVDPYPLAYGRIANTSEAFVFNELSKIISDELVEILVIGVPYFLDGKASKMTQKILDFCQRMSQIFTLPIYRQDETLSSYSAKDRMENSPQYNFKVDLKQIDAVAATIILEDFLQNTNPQQETKQP
jgi:putative holliday junction resolvase